MNSSHDTPSVEPWAPTTIEPESIPRCASYSNNLAVAEADAEWLTSACPPEASIDCCQDDLALRRIEPSRKCRECFQPAKAIVRLDKLDAIARVPHNARYRVNQRMRRISKLDVHPSVDYAWN
uniref:Uncharacterized protein n=1 Tax=uncultured Bacteroidota bacterium TaxID=152509 RepID=H5SB18_9BACT|nr:hypothetical protein HGMM_F06F04C35 [uncultured Bacteroidetes bacterium]